METKNIQFVSIDIRKRSIAGDVTIPQFVQGDTNVLKVTILENGQPADLSGIGRVVANFKRNKDKNVTSRLVSITDNVVTYNIGQEETLKDGTAEVEIQFFNLDNTKRLSTLRFKVHVTAQIGSDEIISNDPEYTLLQQLFIEVGEIEEEATTQAQYAKDQGDYAKEAAESTMTNWLSPVANYTAVQGIPNPQHGDTVQALDNGYVYRYESGMWNYTQGYGATALANVTAQLAEKTSQLKSYNVDLKGVRPLVTFVVDDGDSADSLIEDISAEKGVPFVSAAYPNCPNTPNLKRLHDDLGWEIAGSHLSTLEGKTETEIRNDFNSVVTYLEGLGLEAKNFVYANGFHNALVRKITSEYFDCACESNTKYPNYTPLTQYNLKRVAMGSHFDTGEGTLTYYKSKVDEANQNNGWLIFMLHPSTSTEYQTQLQHIRDTIDYIKTLGVDIVTLEQGIKVFGNKKIVGDYSNVNTSNDYFVVGADGTVKNKIKGLSQSKDVVVESLNGHTSSSVPSSFLPDKITYTPIDTSNVTGFPENQPGVLETYRLVSYEDKYTYQKYSKFNSEGFYVRNWKNGAWTNWIMESFRLPTVVYNVPAQTIQANGIKDISIPVSGNIGYGDSVIANPYVSLEHGLTFSAILESPTTVKLRIANVTTAAVSTAAKDWRIIVVKNVS